MEQLSQEEIVKALNARSSEVRSAASSNTMWAGWVATIMTAASAVAGGAIGARAADYTNATLSTVLGLILGGAAGLIVGMAVYSQRRLQSNLARRIDVHFSFRERA